MDFFTAMEVSASGLAAQRVRMNVSASNLANVNTTRTADGGTYAKKSVVVESVPFPGARTPGVSGVAVRGIVDDPNPPVQEYDPEHPDADENGYVSYPNINTVEEMVDMITASRAYEAGVTALSTSVSMAERALGIGR
jgi:flagellar basal-body rod protein FlgC